MKNPKISPKSPLRKDEVEGVLLDCVFECWKALDVFTEQEPKGWPDITEAEYLVGTDFVLKQYLSRTYKLLKLYNTRDLLSPHHKCRKLLKTWKREHQSPDPGPSQKTTDWMQLSLDTVLGMHAALFAGKVATELPNLVLLDSNEVH